MMTKEEKELLLKDICARLRYGVKVHCEWNIFLGDRISDDGELVSINTYDNSIHFKRNSGRITEIPFNRIDGTVLHYLRPMLSMTDEEGRIYCAHRRQIINSSGDLLIESITAYNDFLNSHHFDYRGLIPIGLALEAPEDMYKF